MLYYQLYAFQCFTTAGCQDQSYKQRQNTQMKMQHDYTLTAIYFLLYLFTVSYSLTGSSTTAPNTLYSNAGVATFDTTPYFNTATTTLNPALFTITFTRTLTTTTYRFGCSIHNINYQITNNKLNYTVLPTTINTSNSAQIAFYTNNANRISVLKIGYMTIEPLFGSYYFSYRMLLPNRNFIQTTASSYTQISTGDGPFNTSKTYNLWITILGVDASLAANNQIDLYPSASVSGTNSISYVIQTISPTTFYLSRIVIMAFIYNTAELLALSRSATMTLGSFGNTFTTSLSATDGTNSVRSFNTLVGIVGFHIQSLTYLQFTTTITPDNSMSFASSYSYNYVNFNYLIATFTYCAPATPYLVVSTKICYDVCPIRYSTDTLYSECNSCPTYDCYYCATNGLCTQCSSGVDFRIMDASTNRCIALDGYYDNGSSSQAVACNASACLTCSSAIFCLSCQTGKYLTASNTCVSCMLNCNSCTNATSCSQCSTGYIFLSSNNTCFLNCTPVSNCLTCTYTSSLLCSTCANGYQLQNNTCNSVCGDGNRASNQICDDGNTQNNDGCSSTCNLQLHFFCADTNSGLNILSVCSACPSHCDKCINSSYCSNCSYGYSQNISSNTAQCIISCIPQCSVCNGSLCTSCNAGFSLVTSSLCQPICGDGFVYNGEACDDGNKIDGDGCSSTCQTQPNFNCTTNSSNTSVCSLLTLSITLASAVKDDYSNSLVLAYHLSHSNYSPFKSIDWSTVVTQKSNLQLGLQSFSYDSSTSNVLFRIKYHKILTSRQLTLQFSLPNSPPFNHLGNISFSTVMTASNNLSLWAYDNVDYYIADILHYVAFALTMFALVLFVLGYYAGKLIALQLISTFQLTYYCLLAVQNMAPGFVAFKQFRYSNGYHINLFGQSTPVSSQHFSFLGFDHILGNNFNLNFVLVLAPLILALINVIFSKCKSSQADTSQPTTSTFFRGEFVFYGLMFAEYSLIVPLLTIAKDFTQLGLTELSFLLVGVIFLLFIILYNCLLRKFSKQFGQFIQTFKNNRSIHFYYFLQLQKLIIACLLVFLNSSKYQMFTVVAAPILKLIILIRLRPYSLQGGNFRPFLNSITQLAIASLFCLYNFISHISYQFHYYVPFFIIGHLFVSVVYNLYFFIKTFKKKRQESARSSKVSDVADLNDRNPWKNIWQSHSMSKIK